jgi:hypothetical protein
MICLVVMSAFLRLSGRTVKLWPLSRFVNHPAPSFPLIRAMLTECAMPPGQSLLAKPALLAKPVAAITLGLALLALPTLATNDAVGRQSLFVITDQEGYGTGECLEKQGGCGKIIADSFCESKGFKVSDFYRKAAPDEVTGSISSERRPPPRDPIAYIISCK